jgi:EAL domain-containing protein (putative c-di-GMP-specific phosphodiesterase class I)
VAVNVSTLQLRQHDLTASIKRILTESGLEPGCLELEITESVMQNEATIEKLYELKEMGIYISIDDFGTGYSSFSYLKKLPVDALKIDKSFICDIYTDSKDADIVKAIISLAKTLKLKVIAEGVETDEQLHFLKQYKCDEVQGYLINPPVRSQDFDKLLQTVQSIQERLKMRIAL